MEVVCGALAPTTTTSSLFTHSHLITTRCYQNLFQISDSLAFGLLGQGRGTVPLVEVSDLTTSLPASSRKGCVGWWKYRRPWKRGGSIRYTPVFERRCDFRLRDVHGVCSSEPLPSISLLSLTPGFIIFLSATGSRQRLYTTPQVPPESFNVGYRGTDIPYIHTQRRRQRRRKGH